MADNSDLASMLGDGTKSFLEYLRRSGRNLAEGGGAAVDWLAGGARSGAEPTLAMMQPGAADQPFLPTADSGGRLGMLASALTGPMTPMAVPKGGMVLGAGPAARVGGGVTKELKTALGKQASLLKESPPVSQEAAAKALADIQSGVSPYHALTEASGFSMAPEARAARAAEQGFSNEPLFHGSSSTEIAGFNPKKKGSYTGAADADVGYFMTPNPQYAHNYMGKVREEVLSQPLYDQMEKQIDPLFSEWIKARNTNPERATQLQGQMDEIRHGYDGTAFNAEHSPGALYPVRVAPGNVKNVDWRGSNMSMDYRGRVVRDAAQDGHDSARYINTPEGSAGDEVIAFRPEQVRSPFAAYNPNWSHRPDLLASRAPTPHAPQTEEQKRAAIAELLRNGGT